MPGALSRWIDNQAARLALLSPLRGGIFDFVLGALIPLAMPPAGAWPLLFIIFPALYFRLMRIRRWRDVALTGWLFGFGQFFAGLYWIGFAFLVEPDLFLWMMPFAVTLLPAALAAFPMLAVLLWHWLFAGQPRTAVRVFGLVLCLVLASWARSAVLTGLPWNLYGMSALGWLPLAQSARFWGVHGLSLLMLTFAFLPVFLRHERLIGMLISLALPLLVWDGHARLAGEAASRQDAADALRVRIVQPSVPQNEKWVPENRPEIIRNHLELTALPGEGPPDLVVWPETALPVLLEQDVRVRKQIAGILPDAAYLVTGGLRREPLPEPTGGRSWESHNSVFVISSDGGIKAVYDKHHLVPFGEYLPWQKLLERLGLRQLTRLAGGFAPGGGPETIALEGLGTAFSPLICYEVIFPGRVTASPRPDVMITVTNDGWFGRSAGPWQHLALGRMRSIEEGLPLLRSANTGVSAVIDAVGRRRALLPLMQRGVLDTVLPPAAPPTLYAKYGDAAFFALFAFVAALVYSLRGTRRKPA